MIKKNKFTLLGIIFFSNFLCVAQNSFMGETRDLNPNTFKDWQTEDLICKVSKLKTVRFIQTEKFGEAVDIGIDSVYVLFNNNGDYLSKSNYSLNDQWYLNCKSQGYQNCSSNYKFYEYYEGSNCLKEERGRKAGNKSYYVNYKCTSGLKQSCICFFDNIAAKKYVYQYDANENNIRIEFYNIASYSEDETIETIWLYEYNTNKQIIERKIYNADGKMTDSYKYKYDLKGNLISREKYSHSYKMELKEQTMYTYDAKNNILSENPGSKPNSTWYKYIYNPNGTIKQITKQNLYYTEYTIKYISFDNKGNWTEKIETNSLDNSFKVKRVIEY